MKRINIRKKEWIRGGLLLAGGVLFGALVFNGTGNSESARQDTSRQRAAHQHSHDSAAGTGQKAMSSEQETSTTYTCSMHPQVRQDEPGKCPICGMDLIPAEESGQSKDPDPLEMTKEAVKLAEIQTSRVSQSQANKTLSLNGKVEVDQRKIYVQPGHFPGRIEELAVSFEGEYVEKGQVIATIYSPELISAQQELLEALEVKNTNPQMLEAARNKLRQWKLTDQQIQAIEEKGTVRETMKIRADVSGIVHKQMVREGDYIQKGTRLFHIARIDKVWIHFDAYQDEIPFIDKGDPIKFTVSSMPGKTFSSRVTFVDPLMNEKSRVAKVRAEASNTSGHLKPGMFAKGILKGDGGPNARELTVPKSAVMWTGTRSVVWVKQPDKDQPVFSLRQVTLGPSLGNAYVIKSGLEKGEQVVTHGTFAVDAAAQLADKPSMMNQPEESEPAGQHQHGNPDHKMSDSSAHP